MSFVDVGQSAKASRTFECRVPKGVSRLHIFSLASDSSGPSGFSRMMASAWKQRLGYIVRQVWPSLRALRLLLIARYQRPQLPHCCPLAIALHWPRPKALAPEGANTGMNAISERPERTKASAAIIVWYTCAIAVGGTSKAACRVCKYEHVQEREQQVRSESRMHPEIGSWQLPSPPPAASPPCSLPSLQCVQRKDQD